MCPKTQIFPVVSVRYESYELDRGLLGCGQAKRAESQNYRDLFRHVQQDHDQKLNLETCTRQEVFAFLDKKRESYTLSNNALHVNLIKMALVFLKRKDLAEAIEFPEGSL